MASRVNGGDKSIFNSRRVIPKHSEESALRNSNLRKVSLQNTAKLGFGDGLPGRVLFPFQAQVHPVGVFRKNQLELLLAPPSLDFFLPCQRAGDLRKLLVVDQHVKVIT